MEPKPKPKKRAPKKKPVQVIAPEPTTDVAHELKVLEDKLDAIIEAAPATLPAAQQSEPPPPTPHEVDTAFDTAREMLSTDFYLRRWGQAAMRNRSEEVDD